MPFGMFSASSSTTPAVKKETLRERAARPTSFEFVTFSDLQHMRGRAATSQIRKHAMKDIGITRRRPEKRRRGYIELPWELLPIMPAPYSTSIGGGAIDPFLGCPVELDDVGKRLVAYSKLAHYRSWRQFSIQ